MANDGIPVEFLDVHCNSFYFSDETNDVETDAFQQSSIVLNYKIKSKDNKCLILNAEGDFQFENSTVHQFNIGEFNIHTYKNNDLKNDEGRAVMLYVCKEEQKMVACCRTDSEVYAKAMELPTDLPTSHEALFYMKELSTPSSFMFQSTLFPGCFLGFQRDDDNPSRHKLVLVQDRDEVDEVCHLQMR